MSFLAFQAVQLVPDGSIFIHIALILIMIWILNRTFFRPINRIIEAREKNKGGRFGEAANILAEVGEKQKKYNQALLEARSKGYELIETERAEAVSSREQAISAVKAETAQIFAQEKAELEKQTVAARSTIAAEAEQMADRISSSILKTT